MATIRVVTDSGADLDPLVCSRRAISVVPLDVRLGDLELDVTRSWSAEDFWHNCANTSALPETSAPSPGAFAETFDRLSGGGDGVVCVTLSSKLSATYQAAVAGAEAVAGRVPVKVVDSLSVTMGEGLCVLAAADAADGGADLDEAAAAAAAAVAAIQVFGALDPHENLRKGGRVGGAQALVGSLLSIKPVITVRDGVVEPESRQRTRGRSLRYLADKVDAAGQIRRLAVVHADAPDLDDFLSLLGDSHGDIPVSYIGPVIGTHCGPGTIGVCFELSAP